MKLKKILAVALSASLLLTVSACNGSSDTDNDTAATTTSEAGDDSSDTQDTSGGSEYTTAPDLSTPDSEDYSYADDVEDSEYVIENGITDKMAALSELNVGNQVRLAEVMKKAANGEEITVAYIGGSITQGSTAGDDSCYARKVTDWFEETFPDATVNYVRAGIGATGSYIGVHRVDSDVLSYDPDLVFVEFSVNDTTENTQRNINSYDSLLRKIWNSESSPAIVCIGMTQDDGTSFQSQHLAIAQSYDLPFISYRNAILYVIDRGYIEWTDISDDNIHPNTVGHSVLTEIITHYLASVNDNRDNITGEESDFSTAYTDDIFANAALLTPNNFEASDETGTFAADKNNSFGNFTGYWMARVSAANGFGGAKLVFENVEAQNIGLLYGEIVGKGEIIEVYVDGNLEATIDANFPDGWGNYTEAVEIVSFDEVGVHTVEIVPQDTGEAAVCYITALAIS